MDTRAACARRRALHSRLQLPADCVLDRSEPKVGDRYVLGFTLAYGNDKFVFVPGVINLKDPSQADLIGDMERFLTIESSAERSGFAPYLAALEDRVPWIRDIAVHRLTSSERCNASPVCAKKFLEVVKRQLGSDTPNERQQAVGWLIWVDSVSRNEAQRKCLVDGLPLLPDSKIRALLNEATDDPNVSIGDRAFQYREEFDFYRSKSPGDCFAIVPSLRKSAGALAFGRNQPGASLVSIELHLRLHSSGETRCIDIAWPG